MNADVIRARQAVADRRYHANHPEASRARNKKFYAKNREQQKVRAAAWKAANPDRSKASTKAWRDNNKERFSEIHKAWRAKNPEAIKARRKASYQARLERELMKAREWKKSNPARTRALSAKRIAAKLKAAPKWANQFFMEEAYDLAQRRTRAFGYPWHVDHIVPLQSDIVCGLHWERNFSVIPGAVNQSKSNRHWPDMPVETRVN